MWRTCGYLTARFFVPVSLLSLGGLLSAASSGSTTTVQRQSGVAPHPVPQQRSGQKLHDGRAQLYVHTSHLTGAQTAPGGESRAEANNISRHMLGNGFRIRLGDNWDLGLLWEYQARPGAVRLAETPPSTDKGVFGAGLDLGVYSLDPHLPARHRGRGVVSEDLRGWGLRGAL